MVCVCVCATLLLDASSPRVGARSGVLLGDVFEALASLSRRAACFSRRAPLAVGALSPEQEALPPSACVLLRCVCLARATIRETRVPELGLSSRTQALAAFPLEPRRSSHELLVVKAYAGTGKTHTVVEFARRRAGVSKGAAPARGGAKNVFEELCVGRPSLERLGDVWSARAGKPAQTRCREGTFFDRSPKIEVSSKKTKSVELRVEKGKTTIARLFPLRKTKKQAGCRVLVAYFNRCMADEMSERLSSAGVSRSHCCCNTLDALVARELSRNAPELVARFHDSAAKGPNLSSVDVRRAIGVRDDAPYAGKIANDTRRVLNAFLYSCEDEIASVAGQARFYGLEKWWAARKTPTRVDTARVAFEGLLLTLQRTLSRVSLDDDDDDDDDAAQKGDWREHAGRLWRGTRACCGVKSSRSRPRTAPSSSPSAK